MCFREGFCFCLEERVCKAGYLLPTLQSTERKENLRNLERDWDHTFQPPETCLRDFLHDMKESADSVLFIVFMDIPNVCLCMVLNAVEIQSQLPNPSVSHTILLQSWDEVLQLTLPTSTYRKKPGQKKIMN